MSLSRLSARQPSAFNYIATLTGATGTAQTSVFEAMKHHIEVAASTDDVDAQVKVFEESFVSYALAPELLSVADCGLRKRKRL